MVDYLKRVFILTLKWDNGGAEFILRVGDIVKEDIHNATIRLKKPKGGYYMLTWERRGGTLFNYLLTYPNNVSVLLESDRDDFIEEGKAALDKYFMSTLSHDEKLFIKAHELGFITDDGKKTELGRAFDKGFIDKDGKQTKSGEEKLRSDGSYD